MFDTYNCDYLQHRTFRFHLIDFQLNTDSPGNLRFLPPSDTQISVSQENAFKKRKKPVAFFFPAEL